jgi:hydroxyethylthiazole kinase-like sugar kinase family protein
MMLCQVTDGEVVLCVSNGHHLLPLITAMGCSVTALIAGSWLLQAKRRRWKLQHKLLLSLSECSF